MGCTDDDDDDKWMNGDVEKNARAPRRMTHTKQSIDRPTKSSTMSAHIQPIQTLKQDRNKGKKKRKN